MLDRLIMTRLIAALQIKIIIRRFMRKTKIPHMNLLQFHLIYSYIYLLNERKCHQLRDLIHGMPNDMA